MEVLKYEVLNRDSGELIILADYGQTLETLKSLAKEFENMVVTKENFEEGKEARKTLRDYRYAIQNIKKHNTNLMNEAKNIDKARHDSLIEVISPTEDKIDAQIKTIEEEKERLKREEEQKEVERVKAIKDNLQTCDEYFERRIAVAKTDKELEEYKLQLDFMESKLNTDFYQEYSMDAEVKLNSYRERMKLVEGRIQEAKDLEKQKFEQQEKERQFEKREAELKAREDALKVKEAPMMCDVCQEVTCECEEVQKELVVSERSPGNRAFDMPDDIVEKVLTGEQKVENIVDGINKVIEEVQNKEPEPDIVINFTESDIQEMLRALDKGEEYFAIWDCLNFQETKEYKIKITVGDWE